MHMKLPKIIWVLVAGFIVITQASAACPPGMTSIGDNPDCAEGATSSLQVNEEHLLLNPLTATSTSELIANVGRFLIGVSTALVAIFILWGAFLLMTSGGSPERVEKGKKTIFYAILGFVVLLVAGGVATLIANILGGTADPIDGVQIGDAPITTFDEVINILVTISQWMFGILIALSIVMILYSAFLYMFSGGSDDKVKKAKDTLTYAIIAVVVAVLAGGVGVLVQNFIGGDSTGGWTETSCARMDDQSCPVGCSSNGWACEGNAT